MNNSTPMWHLVFTGICHCTVVVKRVHDPQVPQHLVQHLHNQSTLFSKPFSCALSSFSALTLLVGCQEEHQASENWVMRCWCGYLSEARCMLFAYGPADANASQNPIISHLIQIQTGFTFLVPDYPGRPGKRPLNGCLSVCHASYNGSLYPLPRPKS